MDKIVYDFWASSKVKHWPSDIFIHIHLMTMSLYDGKKSSVILASEAARIDQVNRAQGYLHLDKLVPTSIYVSILWYDIPSY